MVVVYDTRYTTQIWQFLLGLLVLIPFRMLRLLEMHILQLFLLVMEKHLCARAMTLTFGFLFSLSQTLRWRSLPNRTPLPLVVSILNKFFSFSVNKFWTSECKLHRPRMWSDPWPKRLMLLSSTFLHRRTNLFGCWWGKGSVCEATLVSVSLSIPFLRLLAFFHEITRFLSVA